MVAGLIGSFIFKGGRRKKEVIVARGSVGKLLSSGVLTFLYKLVKPALQIYATKLLKNYLEARILSNSRPSGFRESAQHVDIR